VERVNTHVVLDALVGLVILLLSRLRLNDAFCKGH
jgi:hypothetical protein